MGASPHDTEPTHGRIERAGHRSIPVFRGEVDEDVVDRFLTRWSPQQDPTPRGLAQQHPEIYRFDLRDVAELEPAATALIAAFVMNGVGSPGRRLTVEHPSTIARVRLEDAGVASLVRIVD